VNGRCARAAGVAAGFRFRQPEATHHSARGEERHVLLPLLVGAELHDRRGAKRGMSRNRKAVRCVDLRQLVDHDHEADEIEPRPTELFRPRHAEEPELTHLADVVPRELGVGVELLRDRCDFFLSEMPDHLTRGEMRL